MGLAVAESNKKLEVARSAFPVPKGFIEDKVILGRRQGYLIRTTLYRCLSEVSNVKSAFYGHPEIQTLLTDFARSSFKCLSVCHLGAQVHHLWCCVFDERNLAELLLGKYPLIPFLKATLLPFLQSAADRFDNERTDMEVIRSALARSSPRSASKERRRSINEQVERCWSIYELRHCGASQTAIYILSLVSNLVNIRGTGVIQWDVKDPPQQQETTAAIIESDDEESRQTKKTVSIVHFQDAKVLELKRCVFADEGVLIPLLGTCVRFVSFPAADVIIEATRILRMFTRQATKNFSSVPPCAPKCILGIIQCALGAVFVVPNVALHADRSSSRLSSLQKFVSGKDAEFSLCTQIVSTLYESFRGLYR